MKKHRQLLALFICLVMSVSLLTGYSETKAATEERRRVRSRMPRRKLLKPVRSQTWQEEK